MPPAIPKLDAELIARLTPVAAEQGALFAEKGLRARLQAETAAAANDFGAPLQKMGRSISKLSSAFGFLTVLSAAGVPVPAEAWPTIREQFLPALYALKDVNFQGRRSADPPWHSDLGTADVGVALALALQFDSPALDNREPLAAFVRSHCLEPIVADWLDDRTRIHALDSMGHNWWAVIVAGAGTMAAVLGDDALAASIAAKLAQWARYPGNGFDRKQPNFGTEGDYVEGYNYCDYALSNIATMASVYPGLRIVPDLLSREQALGLVQWLKYAFVPVHSAGGVRYHPQRFGDVGLHRRPHLEVWQTLARLTGDTAFLQLAHTLKPLPDTAAELLTWLPAPSPAEPAPAAQPAPATQPTRQPLQLFPTSGLAFLQREGQLLTARASEFWNHNHLDAGSYILHQDNTVWIDDSGTCPYGNAAYTSYYVQPQAHNVSYAPALVPPGRRGFDESLPNRARYLAHATSDHLTALCADTGILSGSALVRSYRWFFQLSGGVVLVWDDLAGFSPQPFVSRLHSPCAFSRVSDTGLRLQQDGKTCPVEFFSDTPATLTVSPGRLTEDSPASTTHPAFPDYDDGHAFEWQAAPALRAKFGFALGTGLDSARWSASANAGECSLKTLDARWDIWFNPLADGRIMHQNCISRWRTFETDAYALLLRTAGGRTTLHAIEASVLRNSGSPLTGALARPVLTEIAL